MTDNKELYAFGNLRHYLNSKGIHVREPYAPIDPNNKEYYKGGKHLTFGKDGIYLELPDGSKHLTSSLRHPKCPNGQKEALMTVGQGSASLSC